MTMEAAIPVLQAMEQLGQPCQSKAVERALRNGSLQVRTQVAMPLA